MRRSARARNRRAVRYSPPFLVGILLVLFLAYWIGAGPAAPASAGGADARAGIVATVGSHPITEKEVESRVESQLISMQSRIYQIKRTAIQAIADDYLLQQGAQAQHLSVAEYLKRQAPDSSVTDADARKYYEDHKQQYRQPYEQVRASILDAILNQHDNARRETVLAKLRKNDPLKVMIDPPRVKLEVGDHPSRGPADAPVRLVEFADFQCPFCGSVATTLSALRAKYGKRIRIVYFDYPLSFHAHAMDAARAARCAREQGKFWEYHDALFANQSKLAPPDLKAVAIRVGVDGAKFSTCFDSGGQTDAINRDEALGERLGVTGTPAFFINGRSLSGAQPQSEFESIIDDELSGASSEKLNE